MKDESGRVRVEGWRRKQRKGATQQEYPELDDDMMLHDLATGRPPEARGKKRKDTRRFVYDDGVGDDMGVVQAPSGSPEVPATGKPGTAEAPAGSPAVTPASASEDPLGSAVARGQKRTAEEPADDSERATRPVVDVEDLAARPLTAAPADEPMGAQIGGDIGSMEVVESGEMTALKAELMSLIRTQVSNQYRKHELDVDKATLESIASLSLELGAVDVAEVYSPHRFSARAHEFQLRPGFAADLEELKPDGKPWNLENRGDIAELKKLIDEQDPYLLTGSPPCDPFSALQNINRAKLGWSEEECERRRQAGRHHLLVSIQCYWKQMSRGRALSRNA